MPGIERLEVSKAPKRVIRHASPTKYPLPSPSPSPPPMAPTRNLYTTITTIHVGPPKSNTTFHAHTPLLTASSSFFAAALSPTSAFLEATTNIISLPEVCPSTFRFWLQWLYTRNLAHEDVDWDPPAAAPALAPPPSTTTAAPPPKRPIAFFPLIRLYKVAAFLGCEALLNDLVDEIARVSTAHNAAPGPHDTYELWGEECAVGGVRELVLDLFVGLKTEKLVREAADEWDEGFLRALVLKERERGRGVVRGVPVVRAWEDRVVRCQAYHVHAEGERCVGVLAVGG
ncbi:hypothetical protein MMC13_002737 [Lambiella insularis]|nr:hypothetical protein [Lambiella insularis]